MEELENDLNSIDESVQIEGAPKRPVFLTVLCVLSFIGTGGMLLSALTGFISGPLSNEELEKSFSTLNSFSSMFGSTEELQLVLEKTMEKQRVINEKFYLNSLINTAVYSLGLLGAIFMWKQRKLGFHLYVIYSLLAMSAVYIIVPISLVLQAEIIQSAIITAVWIGLYAINIKHLNKN